MARMINISSAPQRFELAGMPGSKPTVIVVPPGEEREFPDGYCRPIKLAKRELFPSIIERMSARRASGSAPAIATVVPVGSAAHKAWEAKQPTRAKPGRKPKPRPAATSKPSAPSPAQEEPELEEFVEGEED